MKAVRALPRPIPEISDARERGLPEGAAHWTSSVNKRPLSKASAFHEAAHAVARLYVGARATDVEIRNDGSGLSHGTGELWEAGYGQYALWNFLLYALAGPYAEARVSHRDRVLVMFTRGAEDYRATQEPIAWLVARGYAATERAAWRHAESETLVFLRERWPAITRVAAALLKSGRLSALEVHELAGA
jgi:hypothetical protein